MPKLVIVRDSAEDSRKSYWNYTTSLKFIIFFSLALVLLAAASGGWYYWAFKMFDTKSGKLANIQLHSMLMTIGSITVNGFSIITYRLCKCFYRWNIKLAHAFIETAVLVVIGFGVYEAFLYHVINKFDHLNSLHGHIAAVTVILYIGQFIMGMFSFGCLLICENVTDAARAQFIPFHATLGLTTFLLSVMSWLTGVSQITFWRDNLGPMSEGDVVAVACCWVVILLAVVCMYILTTEDLRYTSHIRQNTRY